MSPSMSTEPALAPEPAADGYEVDFYAWTHAQARLLRERRFEELDLANVIEELESLGRSDLRALRSHLRVLLTHLLKWRHQPDRRGRSRLVSMSNARAELEMLVEENPSLSTRARFETEHIPEIYRRARHSAEAETGLLIGTFPETCPFTFEEIFDPGFPPREEAGS